MDKRTLESNLYQFTGTQSYHPFSVIARNALLTDGAFYLANEAGCFWLMDIVASVRSLMRESGEAFFVVQLTKNEDGSATVTICTDMDGDTPIGVVHHQAIEVTNFPLDSIKLYVAFDGHYWVIMLPSEY